MKKGDLIRYLNRLAKRGNLIVYFAKRRIVLEAAAACVNGPAVQVWVGKETRHDG